jgi:hypothetical protein
MGAKLTLYVMHTPIAMQNVYMVHIPSANLSGMRPNLICDVTLVLDKTVGFPPWD